MPTPTVEHFKIEIEEDFMARQTRAEPVHALAELIWNSLDADATHVTVEFEFRDLAQGMSKIVVYDDGHGIPRDQAKQLFGHLGGSWKRLRRRTSSKDRMVHGQEGRGRYKAFALGRAADWKVCYVAGDTPKSYTITLLERDLKDVAISEERNAPRQKPGVIVEITNLKRDFRGLHSEAGLQELAEIFALYLINYRDVRISVHGNVIDPSALITRKEAFSLSPISEDGNDHAAHLEIVEWGKETKRALYLCNAEGFPLSQVDIRFHVGQFYFSAYLKSDYIAELHNNERLGIAEL
jgi:histidine kinase/DNA gyrase B/HSP90-like ATPase